MGESKEKTSEQLKKELDALKLKIARLEKSKQESLSSEMPDLDYEELIQKSENKLLQVLDATPFPVAVVDLADDHIFYWSKSAKDLFGHTPPTTEEWYNKAYPDPAYRKEVIKRWKPIVSKADKEGETVCTGEYNVSCADGSVRICELYASFLPDNLIVTFNDITKRKHAEEELKKQTGFIDKVIESSALSTWISDEKGTVIKVNPACLDFFGAKEEEIIGKYNLFNDSVIKEQGFMPEIKKVFDKGIVANIVIDYDFGAVDHVGVKNATHKIINSIFTPILNKEGKVTNVIVQSIDLTDMKRAEGSAIEERNKARQYLNIAEVMLVSINADGIVELINPMGCEILGYTSEEIVGRNWFDLVIPEAQRKMVKDVAKKVFTGEIESVKYFENNILTKSGEERLMAFHNSVIRNNQGEILSTLSSGEDITEKKLSEKSLSESEEKFRSIFELSPLGLSMTGVDGSMKMNKAFCEMLGYTEKELKSKNWKEITHPDDIRESANMVKSLLEGKIETAKYEKRYIHKNGNIVWTDIITTLKKNAAGKPEFFITSINDITERKQSELEIKRYSRIFEDSLNEIYLFDSSTYMFRQVNKAAQKNLGYSMEELKKMTPLSFKPEFTGQSFAELVEPLRTGKKEKIVFETVHQRKDQSLYNVEVHLQLINFEGQLTFVAIILDITDRKQAEEELYRSEEKLKQLLRSIPLPIVYVNSEGIFTFRNDRFVEVFGYSEAEVHAIQDWWQKAYPDEKYRQWVIQNWDSAVKNAAETRADIKSDIYKVTCKDGSVRDVIISGITINDDLLATLIDITELKQAETKLLKEKEYSEELVNALPGLFYQISAEGKFVNWNRNFEIVSGYSNEELAKMNPTDLFEGADKLTIAQRIERVFIDGTSEAYASFASKDGTKAPYYFTGKRIIIDEIPVLVGMGMDISELKDAENELKKHRENLKELVKERTLELENKNKELDNAMKVFVGRELAIRNLQERIRALEGK